jgi:hypothetical protein
MEKAPGKAFPGTELPIAAGGFAAGCFLRLRKGFVHNRFLKVAAPV